MRQSEGTPLTPGRIVIVLFSLFGLALIFLFQRTDVVFLVTHSKEGPDLHFVINRAVRLILNDVCMLLFIYGWFQSRSVTRLAVAIQLIDFFILLPIYLYAKLTLEGDSEISSPLLSQFHRLIVNPTLMILLIPAVYFQRMMKRQ